VAVPKSCPGNFWKMSGTFPEFPRIFPGHIPGISRTLAGSIVFICTYMSNGSVLVLIKCFLYSIGFFLVVNRLL
jgi:hypothetical protein